ncbi:MAG TPA: molybdopterin-dependent oxidoreductase [Ferruginibacter sp.]|nr:molybdopterin-dependent oxidoreductase [Ferruginibacter sp.]
MSDFKEEIVSSAKATDKTLNAFIFFFLFVAISIVSFNIIRNRPDDDGTPGPFRAVLNANEKLFGKFVSNDHLAKTFPVSAAAHKVRFNGDAGLSDGFDPAAWKLQVVRHPGDTLFLTLDEIKALPKTDIVFDFKCIEGWSQVTHWGGVKFSDFVKKYGLDEQSKMNYVGLVTPDEQYYVGIDRKSILHPQTILCYEMNGAPLPPDQGAPLRLIIPVKYGIKHLKRIGTITFSDTRPKDYWFERGYDYFSGL